MPVVILDDLVWIRRVNLKYIKRYIKSLSPAARRELFDFEDLTKEEHMVLVETYLKKELIEHTCNKMAIGKTKYYEILRAALIKIRYKICELDKLFALSEKYSLENQ